MSLEAAIQENTSVLKELLARLSAGAIVAGTANAAAPAAPAVPAAPAAPASNTTPPAETKALTYDADVKGPFLAFAKAKGRDAAMALLTQFGVKRADEVKPEAWPTFISAIAAASK